MFADVAEASARVRLRDEVTEPDGERARRYDELYAIYRSLYGALRDADARARAPGRRLTATATAGPRRLAPHIRARGSRSAPRPASLPRVPLRALLAALALIFVAAPAAEARLLDAVMARPLEPPWLVAPGGIQDAQQWARRRAGTVAFAVAREGRPIRGVAIHRRFYSASVVKAMLALAVLR